MADENIRQGSTEMALKDFFIPTFWDYYDSGGAGLDSVYSFRRKWRMIAVSVLILTMAPLLILTIVDYSLTKKTLETEMINETSRSLTNFNQLLTAFLEDKKSSIQHILRQQTLKNLVDSSKLNSLLKNLAAATPGFQGIAVFDAMGTLQASAGLTDKDRRISQCNGPCLEQTIKNGLFINTWKETEESTPKLIITVKHNDNSTKFLIARFIQDLKPLLTLMNGMVLGMAEDAFILDKKGLFLISAGSKKDSGNLDYLKNFGDPLKKDVFKIRDGNNETLIAGHALVPGTFWRLVVVNPQKEITSKWYKPRIRLIWVLALSIALLIFLILGTATYIVNHIHHADQRRIMALHQIEHTNKLSSIAQLSSGVAHEINNPLAIISEKAGLINDIFTFQETYKADKTLMGLTNDILASVERCSTITRRLLNFARHMETSYSPVNPCRVIREILLFIQKDAQHKGIRIIENMPDDVPGFYSNHGHLQQVFLNLLQNSLVAVGSDGKIEITVTPNKDNTVEFSFKDNGCGIPKKDLHRIFEPFFTTEPGQNATGLGLSIAYGLVKEMDGTIDVNSTPEKGSNFVVLLPKSAKKLQQLDPDGVTEKEAIK